MTNLSPQVIYEDDDLALLWQPVVDAAGIVVTFTPLMKAPPNPLVGWAQSIVPRFGASGLFFVSKWNHWWQVPGLPRALTLAAERTRDFDRVTTYGTSMGGYGALGFSSHVGATTVLSMSPQFSIDRRKVPFERRWQHHARRLGFEFDNLNEGLASDAHITLVYDPMNDDAKHVALVDAPMAQHVRIPFIGHGTPDYLSKAGLLKVLLLAAMEGREAEIAISKHALRREAHYWKNMAEAAHRRGRRQLAARFYERAHELSPRSFGIARRTARAWELSGDREAAARHYLAAARLRGGEITCSKLALRNLYMAVRSHAAAQNLEAAEQLLRLASGIETDAAQLARYRRILRRQRIHAA
ncbi:hypothetical protein [Ancylobacter radicis]|uniref:Tetratricopeptide repeat protein n=1 Tax=Ancylobacter radicis TaxID=2836179 RepID=A0ABS5RB92_9HYPH|nr:hypothetical protein [Ancylobacter radicis]MBS9478939.1 hypothetical protein [Ancylobacter radicis]